MQAADHARIVRVTGLQHLPLERMGRSADREPPSGTRQVIGAALNTGRTVIGGIF